MTTAVRTDRPRRGPVGAARGPRRAVLPAALVLGGIGTALIVQMVFDPFRTDIPLCVVYHLTGLHCPGCGAIRSVHALLDGDLALALRNNALIIGALPLLALMLVRWALRRMRGLSTPGPSTWMLVTCVALAVLFAVARNLPAFWFLAPVSFVGA